jgi:PadR family transcriptional regulator PadR
MRDSAKVIKSVKERSDAALKNALLNDRLVLSAVDKTVAKTNDFLQGTLNLLILKILEHGPMHGWALAQRLKQMSNYILQIGPGSLYPALHKLEQEGWITANWSMSETQRRVKFYTLTKQGRAQLNRQTASWKRLSLAVNSIVLPTEG